MIQSWLSLFAACGGMLSAMETSENSKINSKSGQNKNKTQNNKPQSNGKSNENSGVQIPYYAYPVGYLGLNEAGGLLGFDYLLFGKFGIIKGAKHLLFGESNKKVKDKANDGNNKINNEIKNKANNEIKNKANNEIKNKANNEIKNKANNEIKNKVNNEIKNKVNNEIKNKANNEIKDKANDEIKNKANDGINNEVDNKIKNKVNNEIKNNEVEKGPYWQHNYDMIMRKETVNSYHVQNREFEETMKKIMSWPNEKILLGQPKVKLYGDHEDSKNDATGFSYEEFLKDLRGNRKMKCCDRCTSNSFSFAFDGIDDGQSFELAFFSNDWSRSNKTSIALTKKKVYRPMLQTSLVVMRFDVLPELYSW